MFTSSNARNGWQGQPGAEQNESGNCCGGNVCGDGCCKDGNCCCGSGGECCGGF